MVTASEKDCTIVRVTGHRTLFYNIYTILFFAVSDQFVCADSKSSECQMRNLEGFCRNAKIQMAAKPIECTGTKIKDASILLKCMSNYS